MPDDNCPCRWEYFSSDRKSYEPFFKRQYLKSISRMRNITIETNGTRCDDDIISFCKSLPNVKLRVKLDAIDKVQEYIRPGLDWKKVQSNLKTFHDNGINFTITPQLHIFSIFNLHELQEWCREMDYPIDTPSMLFEPKEFNVSNLPHQLHQYVPEHLKNELEFETTSDCVNLINDLDKKYHSTITDVIPEWSKVYENLHWREFNSLVDLDKSLSKYA
jgi:hypothetical protein